MIEITQLELSTISFNKKKTENKRFAQTVWKLLINSVLKVLCHFNILLCFYFLCFVRFMQKKSKTKLNYQTIFEVFFFPWKFTTLLIENQHEYLRVFVTEIELETHV